MQPPPRHTQTNGNLTLSSFIMLRLASSSAFTRFATRASSAATAPSSAQCSAAQAAGSDSAPATRWKCSLYA